MSHALLGTHFYKMIAFLKFQVHWGPVFVFATPGRLRDPPFLNDAKDLLQKVRVISLIKQSALKIFLKDLSHGKGHKQQPGIREPPPPRCESGSIHVPDSSIRPSSRDPSWLLGETSPPHCAQSLGQRKQPLYGTSAAGP